MRRKDRQVSGMDEIEEIIMQCDCCRLGLNDNGQIYVVPLCFGYESRGGRAVLYFHSAKDGRKIQVIRNNNIAGFEMDTGFKVAGSDKACGYTAEFASVTGSGRIHFVENEEEKLHALDCIMQHYSGRSGWTFEKSATEKTLVFALEVSEISGKKNKL